jgi:hypothetical protein
MVRATCEMCQSIDVRCWHREGRLNPVQSFLCSWTGDGEPYGSINVRIEPSAVILSFRVRPCEGAEWVSVKQCIPVVWTRCYLGGLRPWFRCTARADGRVCGRRAAILYFGSSAGFACRHCYGLGYASQLESVHYRGITRARKIRVRLGGGANVLEAFPPKPKRMHRCTYDRLRAQYNIAAVRCGIGSG